MRSQWGEYLGAGAKGSIKLHIFGCRVWSLACLVGLNQSCKEPVFLENNANIKLKLLFIENVKLI